MDLKAAIGRLVIENAYIGQIPKTVPVGSLSGEVFHSVALLGIPEEDFSLSEGLGLQVDFLQIPHGFRRGIDMNDFPVDGTLGLLTFNGRFQITPLFFAGGAEMNVEKIEKRGEKAGDEKERDGKRGDSNTGGLHGDQFAITREHAHDIEGGEEKGAGDDHLGETGKLNEIEAADVENVGFGVNKIIQVSVEILEDKEKIKSRQAKSQGADKREEKITGE